MTVEELIEKLRGCPQDAEVDAYVYYDLSSHAYWGVTGIEFDAMTNKVTILAENA